MEQTRYWMWTKRRHGGLNSDHARAATYDDSSWEEQAFAEDAAGALGCVWPPRSYSCSFCRREFRSAQALGGHMNVHRRDRARLKQSPISTTPPQAEIPNIQFSSLGFQNPNPHQVCDFGYNPKPNSSNPVSFSSPSVIYSPTSVVTSSTKDNTLPSVIFSPTSAAVTSSRNDNTFCSSIFVREQNPCSSPKLKSNMDVAADSFHHFSDLMRNQEGEKHPRILESGFRGKKDLVRTDLSVSLNVVLRQSTYDEETFVGCKRKRVDHDLHPEVIELSPSSSVDELDLELRLGDRPKVN